MKKFVGITWFILLSLMALGQEKEYKLVWSDEFDVDGEPSTEW